MFLIKKKKKEWEGERESQAGPAPSAHSPVWGSNSRNCKIMTRTKTQSWTLNRLSPPGAPAVFFLNVKSQGTQLAQPVELVTLDLGIMSLCPMLGVEFFTMNKQID